MSQKYLIRIAELESQLRQKDQQLSLVEETEAFLRSALARAEEKIEEDEREIEHLRAQIEVTGSFKPSGLFPPALQK